MMKLLSRTANTFVYTIILINLALIIAYVVYNNAFIINNNISIGENANIMSEGLKNKGNIAINSVRQYNSNGGGFKDIISCPISLSINEVNSGALSLIATPSTRLTYDYGNIYCKFDFGDIEGKLFFDEAEFTEISLDSESKILTYSGGVLMNLDSFIINESEIYIGFVPVALGDGVDDTMNSDDYKGTSGEIEYPDGYMDDDILPKLTIYNEIGAESDYYNVFWNNYITNDFIDKNSNNSYNSGQTVKIGNVSVGNLFFDISSGGNLNYNLKLVKFDKGIYRNENTLIPTETFEGKELNSNNGYICINENGTLDLNKTKQGNEYTFDFINSDYALFVQNNTDEVFYVQIVGEEVDTLKKIYLNPIDDSKNNIIDVIPNHIIIRDNDYIHSYLKMSGNK